MPMLPSPLAALAYAGVKVAGYTVFAYQLNKATGRTVSPVKFGFAKTAIGLVGGIAYITILYLVFDSEGTSKISDMTLFIGAAPVRLAAWSIALGIFYGFRSKPKIMSAALILGVIWSYILDGTMWGIYRILPGMVMPFC